MKSVRSIYLPQLNVISFVFPVLAGVLSATQPHCSTGLSEPLGATPIYTPESLMKHSNDIATRSCKHMVPVRIPNVSSSHPTQDQATNSCHEVVILKVLPSNE